MSLWDSKFFGLGNTGDEAYGIAAAQSAGFGG